MTLEKVLGVGAVRHWFYLAAKPPHVGVSVDRLASPCIILRHAAVRRGDKAFYQVVPSLVAIVGGAPPGGYEAPRAWIFDGVLNAWVPGIGSPRAWLLGARACPKPGYKVEP
jgi:hypothetical protein